MQPRRNDVAPDGFAVDDEWQRSMRDAFLVAHYYERHYLGRYQLFDHDRAMQMRGIDTRLTTVHGDHITIDEKIVRFPRSGKPYTAFCIETQSNTKPGLESDGWFFTGEADFLMYCRMDAAEQEMRIHLIYLPPLYRWFAVHYDELPTFGPLPTRNGTYGRLMAFSLLDPSWYWPMTIFRDGRTIERGFPEWMRDAG